MDQIIHRGLARAISPFEFTPHILEWAREVDIVLRGRDWIVLVDGLLDLT